MPYKDPEVRKLKNREYQRKHYDKKKWYYREKANLYQARIKEKVDEIKSKLSCQECGESHIACLDFHHLVPNLKEINISKALVSGWSLERIKKEIEKCVVLCSNCHRKHHYKEQLREDQVIRLVS